MTLMTEDRPLPADCETMADVRKGVDVLDRALVLMLAERQRYMDAAARIKQDRNRVLDRARIEDVVTKVKAAAREAIGQCTADKSGASGDQNGRGHATSPRASNSCRACATRSTAR